MLVSSLALSHTISPSFSLNFLCSHLNPFFRSFATLFSNLEISRSLCLTFPRVFSSLFSPFCLHSSSESLFHTHSLFLSVAHSPSCPSLCSSPNCISFSPTLPLPIFHSILLFRPVLLSCSPSPLSRLALFLSQLSLSLPLSRFLFLFFFLFAYSRSNSLSSSTSSDSTSTLLSLPHKLHSRVLSLS